MFLQSAMGLPVGLLLGFLLEFDNFNMGSALRSVLFKGSYHNLRIYVTILVANIVFVHLFSALRLFRPEAIPFFFPADFVGGFIFGLGLSFGAGCANIWQGAGTGTAGLAAALLGFMLGTHLIRTSLFAPVFTFLRVANLDLHGRPPTLYGLLAPKDALLQWLLVAAIVAAASWWLIKSSRRENIGYRSWLAAGLSIGGTAILGWVVAWLNGDTYGLSFTQPTLALGRILFFGDFGPLYWGVFMIIGVPIGVSIAALRKGMLRLRIPSPGRLLQLTGSGTLSGVGASIAGGCNVGNGITGVSLLALSSFAAMVSAMAALWLVTVIGNHFTGRRSTGEEARFTSDR